MNLQSNASVPSTRSKSPPDRNDRHPCEPQQKREGSRLRNHGHLEIVDPVILIVGRFAKNPAAVISPEIAARETEFSVTAKVSPETKSSASQTESSVSSS